MTKVNERHVFSEKFFSQRKLACIAVYQVDECLYRCQVLQF